jgi:enamine deaminase RidA (YjgF/YER057c/UK114 family)
MQNMKLIWIVGLLALAGCAGNKPAVGQVNVANGDEEKCRIMREIQEQAKADGLENEKTLCEEMGDKCICVETIICDGKSTCYAVDYIDLEQHFLSR